MIPARIDNETMGRMVLAIIMAEHARRKSED